MTLLLLLREAFQCSAVSLSEPILSPARQPSFCCSLSCRRASQKIFPFAALLFRGRDVHSAQVRCAVFLLTAQTSACMDLLPTCAFQQPPGLQTRCSGPGGLLSGWLGLALSPHLDARVSLSRASASSQACCAAPSQAPIVRLALLGGRYSETGNRGQVSEPDFESSSGWLPSMHGERLLPVAS